MADLAATAPSLLFINQHYWPDVASTGQHLTDLAEHLAAEGYGVTVLCGAAGYDGRPLGAPAREIRRCVEILRLAVPGFRRRRGTQGGRAAAYAAFHARALGLLLRLRRPGLVVSLTTPSLLPVTVAAAARLRRTRFGVWAMDLHPEVETALGLLPRRAAIPLRRAETAACRRAEFIVALGPFMAARLRARGVPPERIREIPVWADGEAVKPVPRDRNRLAAELGLADRFVVMYSGNAGLAHRFDAVLGAMVALRDDPGIFFLFVGGGPRRGEIEAAARSRGLRHFRYLDYVPRERLSESLSLGDVHLLTLRPEMAGLVVPGKLYGIMAAARPVVMIGPRESEPGRTIEAEGIGIVMDPAENSGCQPADRLRTVILRLRSDPEARRQMGVRGRAALRARYDRRVCCCSWSELLRATFAA